MKQVKKKQVKRRLKLYTPYTKCTYICLNIYASKGHLPNFLHFIVVFMIPF